MSVAATPAAPTTPAAAAPQTHAAPPAEQPKGAVPTTPPAEQPKPAEQPAPATDENAKFAKAFAAMSKKEKQLTEDRRRFAAERAELTKQLEEVKQFREFMSNARRDPLAYLKAAGLSYDEVTAAQTNGGEPTPEMVAQHRMEQVERLAKQQAKELEDYKRQQAEERKQAAEQRQQALKAAEAAEKERFYKGAVAFVEKNAVTYELIKLHNAASEVPALIEATYEKTGKLLTVEEAAAEIEQYLVEQTRRATASEKWKKLQQEAAEKEKAEQAAKVVAPTSKGPQQGDTSPRALENTAPATTKPPKAKEETEEERIARAVAAYEKAKTSGK